MAFVSQLVCARPPTNRRTALCAARPPRKPKERNAPTGIPLVDDNNGHNYLRSLHRECSDELVGEKSSASAAQNSGATASQNDVWDTLVDDHTPLKHMIHSSPQSSEDQPSVIECAQARMAARPSNTPKPAINSSAQGNIPPKRRRGRPKGSKSNKPTAIPTLPVSPFISAVREDLRRRNIAARRDLISAVSDTQYEDYGNWEDVQLRAPNGLPDDDANADLLQELLPILAQQENEENRVVPEEERRIKRLIATCYTQFNSIHRSSDRLDNLKPYKLRKHTERECDACNGTGMTVCEYCDGQGYVDLGENGENFQPKFGNNEFTMPKHVMGNIYHCPLCGGLQKERCESCFGTGSASVQTELLTGASKEQKDNRAWKIFDMNELLSSETDRIEVGLDGINIMRAKTRGRRKKVISKEEDRTLSVRKRGRGRPSKQVSKQFNIATSWDEGAEPADVVANGADLTPDLRSWTSDTSDTSDARTVDGEQSLITSGTPKIPLGRPVIRTTDFVNTTDYQVGRRLQRQESALRSNLQGLSDSEIDSPIMNSSEEEEEEYEVKRSTDNPE